MTVVALLTGILLTRLQTLSEQAESANLQRTAQAFRAHAELAHTVWRIRNHPPRVETTLADGSPRQLVMNENGWPVYAVSTRQTTIMKMAETVTPQSCQTLWQATFGNGVPRVDMSSLTQESDHEYSAVLSGGTRCVFASRRLAKAGEAARISYESTTGQVSTWLSGK